MRTVILISTLLIISFTTEAQEIRNNNSFSEFSFNIRVLGSTPDFGVGLAYNIKKRSEIELALGTQSASAGYHYHITLPKNEKWNISIGIVGIHQLAYNSIYMPLALCYSFKHVSITTEIGPKHRSSTRFWGGLKIAWAL